jgi:pyrimidine deaminase RibD-like protein
MLKLYSHGILAHQATLYVPLEPCSTKGLTAPYTGPILQAGIKNVVGGAIDVNPCRPGKGIWNCEMRALVYASAFSPIKVSPTQVVSAIKPSTQTSNT